MRGFGFRVEGFGVRISRVGFRVFGLRLSFACSVLGLRSFHQDIATKISERLDLGREWTTAVADAQ